MEDGSESAQSLKGIDLRVVSVACSAWLGSLVGLRTGLVEIPWLGARVLVLVTVVAIAAVAMSWRLLSRGTTLMVGVSFIAVWFAILVAGVVATSFERDPLQSAATKGSYVRVLVAVTGHPRPRNPSWSQDTVVIDLRTMAVCPPVIGDVPATCNPPSSVGLKGELIVHEDEMKDLVPGSVLEVRGIISKEDWLVPPVAAKLRIIGYSVVKPAPSWQKWSASLRESMREITAGTGAIGPLISGMAIGDDVLLSEELKDSMLVASLTHLTAVSGSHIAISLALVTRVFRGHRNLQAVAVSVFLALVIIVVGPEPSVVRSVTMSSLAVWGMVRRMPSQPLGLLATVVLVSVVIEPWLTLSVGFVLSVVATAGIIVLARPLERSLTGLLPEGGMISVVGSLVAGAVAVTVSASLVTLPILALLNPWLPLWGVLANLLAAPAVAPLTVLGLGAASTCLWMPELADVFVKLAEPFAGWIAAVATWSAGLPLAKLPWPQGFEGLFLALAIVSVMIGGVIVLFHRGCEPSQPNHR